MRKNKTPKRFIPCPGCGKLNVSLLKLCLFCGLSLKSSTQAKEDNPSSRFLDAELHYTASHDNSPRSAPISSRAAALFIDKVITLTVIVAIGIKRGMIVFSPHLTPLASHFPQVSSQKKIVFLVIVVAIDCLYHVGMEMSGMQGTVGKYLVGIRVIDTKGGKIKITNAIIRYFVRTFSTPLLIPLAAMFDAKERTPHDKVSETMVAYS